MEAAMYGLLGTLAGGVITIIVALIAFWKEYKLWKTQFEAQNSQQNTQQKLDRYAKFLGAYFHIEGVLCDVEDILSQKPENLPKRLSNVVSEPDFAEAAVTLNQEKAWVALLTNDNSVLAKIKSLEKSHDKLFEILSSAKTRELDNSVALSQYKTELKKLKELGSEVREKMHSEVCSA